MELVLAGLGSKSAHAVYTCMQYASISIMYIILLLHTTIIQANTNLRSTNLEFGMLLECPITVLLLVVVLWIKPNSYVNSIITISRITMSYLWCTVHGGD